MKKKNRCAWCLGHEIYEKYHDEEWGVPVHDDRLLFEMLILEGAQAGLSWLTVLKKRENYRTAFDNFDAEQIAAYDEQKKITLLKDSGIIRNRLKINAAVTNSKCFLRLKETFGNFDNYIWQFVDGNPIKNSRQTIRDIPTETKESRKMSKALKQEGFKFVGSTICYAFMQATGMVNDHTTDCFRWHKINSLG